MSNFYNSTYQKSFVSALRILKSSILPKIDPRFSTVRPAIVFLPPTCLYNVFLKSGWPVESNPASGFLILGYLYGKKSDFRGVHQIGEGSGRYHNVPLWPRSRMVPSLSNLHVVDTNQYLQNRLAQLVGQ